MRREWFADGSVNSPLSGRSSMWGAVYNARSDVTIFWFLVSSLFGLVKSFFKINSYFVRFRIDDIRLTRALPFMLGNVEIF